MVKKTNRHYKHAMKIMKWRGTLTNQRVNMALDEMANGMRETFPKYIRTRGGFLINLHDMIA